MSDPIHRSPEELVRRYLDACNDRRLDDLDVIFTPGFTSHLRVGDAEGLDRFKVLMRQVYDAFPDVLWTLVETIYAPDRAVLRYYFEATHLGPFLGIPPSHRRVRIDGCEVMHIRDGWVHEIWNYADLMGLAARVNAVNPLAIEM
jgi:predicted ester cyclase